MVELPSTSSARPRNWYVFTLAGDWLDVWSHRDLHHAFGRPRGCVLRALELVARITFHRAALHSLCYISGYRVRDIHRFVVWKSGTNRRGLNGRVMRCFSQFVKGGESGRADNGAGVSASLPGLAKNARTGHPHLLCWTEKTLGLGHSPSKEVRLSQSKSSAIFRARSSSSSLAGERIPT